MTGRVLDRMLDHAEQVRWSHIPADVRDRAAAFVADTLGVGLSARRLPETMRLRRLAEQWGAGSGEPLGGGVGLTPPQAAFVNGFQIHCQEFDAVHEPAVVHAMSVVTAACLAEVESDDCAGDRFLESVVLGVDIAVALGLASRAPMRFFRPATAGLMGAAIALMRLREADRTMTKNALGLAYSHLSGTMQAHIEGSPALAYQIAIAARNARFAADMASAGCTGPHDVIEGPFGYLNLIEGAWRAEDGVDRLGARWAVSELSHKPWPTGRAAHGVLYMLDEILADEALGDDVITRVEARVPPLIKRLVDRPFGNGLSLSQARLCLPFLVATRLHTGTVGLHSFAHEWLTDPAWLPAAEQVAILLDDNDDPNALSPQRLVATTASGRVFERRTDTVFGTPDNPLSAGQQFDKFRACLDFAGVRGAQTRQEQWRALLDLADAPSVRQVMRRFSEPS